MTIKYSYCQKLSIFKQFLKDRRCTKEKYLEREYYQLVKFHFADIWSDLHALTFQDKNNILILIMNLGYESALTWYIFILIFARSINAPKKSSDTIFKYVLLMLSANNGCSESEAKKSLKSSISFCNSDKKIWKYLHVLWRIVIQN